MDMFCSEVEENLREYLIAEGKKLDEQQKDAKAAAKQAAKQAADKKEIAEIKEQSEVKVAKIKKAQFEKIWYNAYAQYVTNLKFTAWTKESAARKDKTLKNDAQALEAKIQSIDLSLLCDISNYRECDVKFDDQATEYIAYCKKIDPNYESSPDELWNTVLTFSENKFSDLKNEAQELAKTLAKAKIKAFKMKNLEWNVKFDNEKIQQKIAEIPLTIEEKIEGIKDQLDALLGRKLVPIMNPEKPEFNLDIILAKMQAFIDPLLAAISPLEAVAGKVPIIGDLAAISSLLSASGGGKKLTKEEIMKLIPKRPMLPANLMDMVKGIFDDILMIAIQLPMVCINVIFQMIDTIIGLFKQIAGIIGVPGIPYPLSLVPDCIAAVPKIQDFIQKVPVLMYASVKGALIDKLAEAMALSVPEPNIDMDLVSNLADNLDAASLIPEVEDADPEKPASKSKPDTKNIEYSDVVKDKLVDVKGYGYDRTDLLRILKSYKEIYNGSKETINKYTGFSGDADMGNLIPTMETITRSQGTPEDFKTKLNTVFSSAPNVAESVTYDRIKNTKSVVGAQYYQYEDQIKTKEPNKEVVLPESIEA